MMPVHSVLSPWQALLVLLIGALVGVLPGLFGVGGGFISVPALHLLAGVPLNLAVGSVACQGLGPVTTGLMHRLQMGRLPLKMPLTMLGGTLAGLVLGLRFLEWAKSPNQSWTVAGHEVPRLEFSLLVCYLVLLLLLSGIIAAEWYFTRHLAPRKRRGWLEHWRIAPLASFSEMEGRSVSLPVLAMLGIFVGFLSGGLGMGGAIVLVPALVFLIGVQTHRAISVTLVLFWFNAMGATVGHALHDNIDLPLVCLLLLGGTVGAKIGSQIAERISGRRLRGYLALVIFTSAILIALRLSSMVW